MGFSIFRKDYVSFDFEGSPIKLTVQRLSGKDAINFLSTQAKLQDLSEKNGVENDTFLQSYELYVDMLSSIVEDVEGVDDLTEWPESKKERAKLFDVAGVAFVMAAMKAYNDSMVPTEEQEKKSKGTSSTK
jgi:hypothetical protein